MLVSAESSYTLADSRGPELDQGALLRLLGGALPRSRERQVGVRYLRLGIFPFGARCLVKGRDNHHLFRGDIVFHLETALMAAIPFFRIWHARPDQTDFGLAPRTFPRHR